MAGDADVALGDNRTWFVSGPAPAVASLLLSLSAAAYASTMIGSMFVSPSSSLLSSSAVVVARLWNCD